MCNLYINNTYIYGGVYMLNLLEVTTILTSNGINAAASRLKVKKSEIYNFLKSNGLVYENGEVKTILDKSNVETKVISADKNINPKPPEPSTQPLNNVIDLKDLVDLTELIEPIREVIQAYNESKSIVRGAKPILIPPSVTDVKQKLFKVAPDVLMEWEQFVAAHKEYKVQSLVSLALSEFIEKYK